MDLAICIGIPAITMATCTAQVCFIGNNGELMVSSLRTSRLCDTTTSLCHRGTGRLHNANDQYPSTLSITTYVAAGPRSRFNALLS